jgi:hypothetical protein
MELRLAAGAVCRVLAPERCGVFSGRVYDRDAGATRPVTALT